jgi:excisionase family DNA binding protein
MEETPMLFPMSPMAFWKQIKTMMEEVVEEKITAANLQNSSSSNLPEKVLLKATEVCKIFQVSKPTLYEWMKQGRLKSFKIKSRRYFSRADIEAVIKQTNTSND